MPLNLVEESYSLFHNLKSKCLVNTRCSHIDIPEAPFLTIWVYHMVAYQRRRILLWNYWNLTECTVAAIDRYHHRRRPRPWPILVRLVRPISAQDGPCRGKRVQVQNELPSWPTSITACYFCSHSSIHPFIHPSAKQLEDLSMDLPIHLCGVHLLISLIMQCMSPISLWQRYP